MGSLVRVLLVLLVLGVSPIVSAQIFDDCLANGAAIDSGLPAVTETMSVAASQTVLDVEVSVLITHTWVGDLELSLQSAAGTNVILQDNDGGNVDDMNLVYSDQGVAPGSEPYTCGCAMQPSPGSMSSFSGENSAGTWTFVVNDTAGGDSGTLDQWCLSLFDVGPPPPIGSLTCSTQPDSGVIDATWTNPTTYDAIEVFLDGMFIESLPGTAHQLVIDSATCSRLCYCSVQRCCHRHRGCPHRLYCHLYPWRDCGSRRGLHRLCVDLELGCYRRRARILTRQLHL